MLTRKEIRTKSGAELKSEDCLRSINALLDALVNPTLNSDDEVDPTLNADDENEYRITFLTSLRNYLIRLTQGSIKNLIKELLQPQYKLEKGEFYFYFIKQLRKVRYQYSEPEIEELKELAKDKKWGPEKKQAILDSQPIPIPEDEEWEPEQEQAIIDSEPIQITIVNVVKITKENYPLIYSQAICEELQRILPYPTSPVEKMLHHYQVKCLSIEHADGLIRILLNKKLISTYAKIPTSDNKVSLLIGVQNLKLLLNIEEPIEIGTSENSIDNTPPTQPDESSLKSSDPEPVAVPSSSSSSFHAKKRSKPDEADTPSPEPEKSQMPPRSKRQATVFRRK